MVNGDQHFADVEQSSELTPDENRRLKSMHLLAALTGGVGVLVFAIVNRPARKRFRGEVGLATVWMGLHFLLQLMFGLANLVIIIFLVIRQELFGLDRFTVALLTSVFPLSAALIYAIVEIRIWRTPDGNKRHLYPPVIPRSLQRRLLNTAKA